MKALFDIRNLSCAYRRTDGSTTRPVLKIERLQIPTGQIVVLLGKSGAGKSTILETLGLMNNTLIGDSKLTFSPSDGTQYQFETIWDQKNIDEVRNRHFSFIFQNTNLMPNFTVYENVCLTQMLQGVSQEKAMEKAHEVMHRIGLQEVDKIKKPHELSGGQRQRVAFVRAIIPNFTVLFGDEPTGNLDENNSRELMQMLTDNIRNKQRTAVIVTHNIDLALEFADQIVILTKNAKDGFGQVEEQNVFRAQNNPQNDTALSQTKTWITLHTQIPQHQMRQVIEKLIL